MLSLKPTRQLALLGIVSGVLTTFVKWEIVELGATTPAPGIFFGCVLAFGLYRWQTQNPLKLAAVILLIVLAWALAFHSAFFSHDFFSKQLGFGKPLTFALLGLIGGCVGSALTAATIYLFAPAFRDRAYWKRVVMFGTVAGVLLAIPEMGFRFDLADLLPWLTERQAEWLLEVRERGFNLDGASLLPLFCIWQAGVAAIVARGITGLK